jgi:hypothetical protein
MPAVAMGDGVVAATRRGVENMTDAAPAVRLALSA